ncbi:MAG: DUF1566 domain-containing protein [Candidatus Latescibacteria bacterium]|nr:DUF1566 domain-containing protein [Candidatus Latescibacterota bacterium]
MRQLTHIILTAMLCTGLSTAISMPSAEADLLGRDLDGINRSVEAYYDTDLDVTWLKDANLAKSNNFGVSGINASNGGMNWETAHEWVDAMNASSYLGVSSWRLPNDLPINTVEYDLNFGVEGLTDGGYANTGPGGGWVDADGNAASELGHLFYVTLGNLKNCEPGDAPAPDGGTRFGCVNLEDLPGAGLVHTGPFMNFDPAFYWAAQEDPRDDGARGRGFNFRNGFRLALGKEIPRNRAWALVDGDVGVRVAVPSSVTPETWARLKSQLWR